MPQLNANKELKTVLLAALKKSGAILRDSLERPHKIRYKGPVNLLTATDKKCERSVIEILKKRFPDHAILSEESKPMVRAPNHSPYQWIIDPIDGTTNFAHHFPVACVSIGLEKEGRVILGGIYDPFREELFFAERGKGAYLNGRPIRVSKVKRLKVSLLATGFPYDRAENADFYLGIFKAFLTRCHGVRRMGSAAIDLAYVACGRFDGFWEFKLNPWDVAAGKLLVEEAGGMMTDFRGRPYSIYQPETCATNGRFHGEMLAVLHRFARSPVRRLAR